MTRTLAAVLLSAFVPGAAPAADAERGAYLARIMDCAGCHMPRDKTGAPVVEAGLSGGTIGFELPGLGVFWAPNLTPDASGLGGWSAAQIETALRTGVRPDGRVLVPVMPWPGYADLNAADMADLLAFLTAQPSVAAERLGPAAAAAQARAPFFRVVQPR